MKYSVTAKKYSMRNSLIVKPFFLLLLAFRAIGLQPAFGENVINFGPHETKIDGSIPYSVIGKYKATFRSFRGTIITDDKFQKIHSVDLAINVGSITSNCPWCDKIVCSHRLLNTALYPNVIFKSIIIIHDPNGYQVKGILAMHGIKKVMTFPFSVERINDPKSHEQKLKLQGTWVINRKDFNIYWNKLLDRGGVLVGDNLTVHWGITINIQRRA